ncbi:MAG: PilZ domain-containing protein [Pseudomonadota bacterium]
MNKAENRRKFARLDLALTVGYRVVDDPSTSQEMSEVTSSDISLGGLRLMTPSALKNGSRLELEILLSEDEKNPIKADGAVVWQSKISNTSYETGVVIQGMNNADKKRFMEFVFDQISKIVTA